MTISFFVIVIVSCIPRRPIDCFTVYHALIVLGLEFIKVICEILY